MSSEFTHTELLRLKQVAERKIQFVYNGLDQKMYIREIFIQTIPAIYEWRAYAIKLCIQQFEKLEQLPSSAQHIRDSINGALISIDEYFDAIDTAPTGPLYTKLFNITKTNRIIGQTSVEFDPLATEFLQKINEAAKLARQSLGNVSDKDLYINNAVDQIIESQKALFQFMSHPYVVVCTKPKCDMAFDIKEGNDTQYVRISKFNLENDNRIDIGDILIQMTDTYGTTEDIKGSTMAEFKAKFNRLKNNTPYILSFISANDVTRKPGTLNLHVENIKAANRISTSGKVSSVGPSAGSSASGRGASVTSPSVRPASGSSQSGRADAVSPASVIPSSVTSTSVRPERVIPPSVTSTATSVTPPTIKPIPNKDIEQKEVDEAFRQSTTYLTTLSASTSLLKNIEENYNPILQHIQTQSGEFKIPPVYQQQSDLIFKLIVGLIDQQGVSLIKELYPQTDDVNKFKYALNIIIIYIIYIQWYHLIYDGTPDNVSKIKALIDKIKTLITIEKYKQIITQLENSETNIIDYVNAIEPLLQDDDYKCAYIFLVKYIKLWLFKISSLDTVIPTDRIIRPRLDHIDILDHLLQQIDASYFKFLTQSGEGPPPPGPPPGASLPDATSPVVPSPVMERGSASVPSLAPFQAPSGTFEAAASSTVEPVQTKKAVPPPLPPRPQASASEIASSQAQPGSFGAAANSRVKQIPPPPFTPPPPLLLPSQSDVDRVYELLTINGEDLEPIDLLNFNNHLYSLLPGDIETFVKNATKGGGEIPLMSPFTFLALNPVTLIFFIKLNLNPARFGKINQMYHPDVISTNYDKYNRERKLSLNPSAVSELSKERQLEVIQLWIEKFIQFKDELEKNQNDLQNSDMSEYLKLSQQFQRIIKESVRLIQLYEAKKASLSSILDSVLEQKKQESIESRKVTISYEQAEANFKKKRDENASVQVDPSKDYNAKLLAEQSKIIAQSVLQYVHLEKKKAKEAARKDQSASTQGSLREEGAAHLNLAAGLPRQNPSSFSNPLERIVKASLNGSELAAASQSPFTAKSLTHNVEGDNSEVDSVRTSISSFGLSGSENGVDPTITSRRQTVPSRNPSLNPNPLDGKLQASVNGNEFASSPIKGPAAHTNISNKFLKMSTRDLLTLNPIPLELIDKTHLYNALYALLPSQIYDDIIQESTPATGTLASGIHMGGSLPSEILQGGALQGGALQGGALQGGAELGSAVSARLKAKPKSQPVTAAISGPSALPEISPFTFAALNPVTLTYIILLNKKEFTDAIYFLPENIETTFGGLHTNIEMLLALNPSTVSELSVRNQKVVYGARVQMFDEYNKSLYTSPSSDQTITGVKMRVSASLMRHYDAKLTVCDNAINFSTRRGALFATSTTKRPIEKKANDDLIREKKESKELRNIDITPDQAYAIYTAKLQENKLRRPNDEEEDKMSFTKCSLILAQSVLSYIEVNSTHPSVRSDGLPDAGTVLPEGGFKSSSKPLLNPSSISNPLSGNFEGQINELASDEKISGVKGQPASIKLATSNPATSNPATSNPTTSNPIASRFRKFASNVGTAASNFRSRISRKKSSSVEPSQSPSFVPSTQPVGRIGQRSLKKNTPPKGLLHKVNPLMAAKQKLNYSTQTVLSEYNKESSLGGTFRKNKKVVQQRTKKFKVMYEKNKVPLQQ